MPNIDNILQSIFNSKDSNWKPSDKIPLINREIEQHLLDLRQYLNSTEYDVESILEESRALCEESRSLVDEMVTCKQEIEQDTMAEIVKSIKDHDLLAKELQCVNFAIDIVYDVSQCGKYVKEFEDGKEVKSYTRAVEAVFDLLLYLDVPSEGFKHLDICGNTKVTAQMILDSLLSDLYLEWNRMISWSIKPGNKKTVVTIVLNIEDNPITIDVINGLEKSKKLSEKVSQFAQFLLKDVLVPIIQNDCTVFDETEELMTVTIYHKANFKPLYNGVIANLRLLFHYLSNKLNIEYYKDNTIMKMIGKEISVDFSDILIKDCLIDTIPNNITELQSYGKITSEIEDFQHFLTLVKIFPNENFSILTYVNNIDVLFASKSSQYFLETSRSIMLKDLSVTMSIGVKDIPNEAQPSTSQVDDTTEEALKILDKTIPKSLFFFPRCMISKSAQELLDLVYVIMEQAVQCSDVVCKKLYNTTRLVFELYDAVVPYHHENYLQTIPQYVALFHNNCMYLAHNLQTFGDKWLILMEGREPDYAISFVDLVQKLRDLGYRHLTVHMQQQRKQILDNIRSSDLNCIVVKDVLSDNAEAAVRQCLRQLAVLKNVWIGVFPLNVFTSLSIKIASFPLCWRLLVSPLPSSESSSLTIRLMATLVTMLIEELIHRASTAEDISAEMAAQLAHMYTIVAHKAPLLFQGPNDIEKNVKNWVKLQELIFVLGGSLKDIEAHWADGTGPLAVHFRIEELRALIKALFQNTQFRANLLAKIK